MTVGIKVNIDYESVLFHQKPSSVLNESFEFLALYLDTRPLLSQKKYSADYLSHIESITGHRPQIIQHGQTENWWGKLDNPQLERKLNSKITCVEFLQSIGENLGTHVIRTLSDFEKLQIPDKVLLKASAGMSGRGTLVTTLKDFKPQDREKWLKSGPLTGEPLLDRRFDFSTYVYNRNEVITYKNIVDKFFHYKGTLIDKSQTGVEGLSFHSKLSAGEWQNFLKVRDQVIDYYYNLGNQGNFCLDSFIYQQLDQLKIYPVCEVNYRKSMGSVAYRLSQKLSEKPFGLMIFGKSLKSNDGFRTINNLVKNLPQVTYLSPGDTRFEVFFICADSLKELQEVVLQLKVLLPGCEFSVEI